MSGIGTALEKSAARLLAALASSQRRQETLRVRDINALLDADLACKTPDGAIAITSAGRAFLARAAHARNDPSIDSFRAQHASFARHTAQTEDGRIAVTLDENESPLSWLARRTGRDGRAMIEPHQLLAGERLRNEFTRAHLMPRTTSNWESPIARGRRAAETGGAFTDVVIGARQRVRHALDAVGPELSGLLLDVCCFLKGLEDVEHERRWPARSAKIVLQLALDRLARHYGYGAQAHGKAHAALQVWSATEDES